jgi:hypothetical protein
MGAVAASNKSKRNPPREKIQKETTHVIVEMNTGRVDGVVGRRARESARLVFTVRVPHRTPRSSKT